MKAAFLADISPREKIETHGEKRYGKRKGWEEKSTYHNNDDESNYISIFFLINYTLLIYREDSIQLNNAL